MSMSKHTKGPWHCRFDAFEEVMSVTSDARLDEQMAEICHVSVGYDEPFESEQQANARLIAAAPELLDALTDAGLQITYLHEKLGSDTGTGNSALARIRAAIAKAEGR